MTLPQRLMTGATAAVTAAILAGCGSSGCIDNKSAIPLAWFYDSATLDRITVSGITAGGVGAPGDSLLSSGSSMSELYLPLRSDATETTFYFSVQVTPADTTMAPFEMTDEVEFGYESIPYFESVECGAMYRYRITSVSHTSMFIDSVGITDSLITNASVERVRIFVRVNRTEES